jgi:predicted HAD superfamily phosphohydrolase YqeG
MSTRGTGSNATRVLIWDFDGTLGYREGLVRMIADNFIADVAGAEAVGIPGILIRNVHEEAGFFCDDLTQVPVIVFEKG